MKPLSICLGIAAIAIAGCNESKPEPKHTLKEVIDIAGFCWENHVGQKDQYAGQVVRWQAVDTKEILTYGFVILPFNVDRAIENATKPTTYHMPFMVSFVPLDADTGASHWVIHGVSSRGENTQGYDSTCEVDVKKRGTSAADIHGFGK